MTPRFDALKTRFTQIKQPVRDAVSDTAQVENTVKEIIASVRDRGDAAVREYSLAFDKLDVASLSKA
ncbi:histidinol dehydrogenase [Rhizobium ruizarguesonis]|uniref:histidinol dehydrogenase n=1 Tax=Rhizobium ruizarguesonis TaxID=2081791 RepID=UPI001FED5A49|nr:histidinol dehydrogenase [Rhizobium ruizarguesonis]